MPKKWIRPTFFSKRFFIVVLVVLFASVFQKSSANAKTLFHRDGRFVTLTTPFSDLTSAQRRELIETTLTELILFLEGNVQSENRYSHEYIQQLKDVEYWLDRIMFHAFQQKLNQIDGIFKIENLVPTAFGVFGGMKFSTNALLGGGASVSGAIICLPKLIHTLDLHERTITSRIDVDVATKAWPGASLGAGMGGGGTLRGGVLLIWGPLSHASEVGGTVWSASKSTQTGIGLNFKAGIFSGLGKVHPFVSIGILGGLGLKEELHFHGGAMIDLERAIGFKFPAMTFKTPSSLQWDYDQIVEQLQDHGLLSREE